MSKYEIITAYKTEELKDFTSQGFLCNEERAADLIEHMTGLEPVNWQRFRLEEDPDYQQPIPYVVLIKGSQIFLYDREAPTEERLKGKKSIGIGGHMSFDKDNLDIFKTAARELKEELLITPALSSTYLQLSLNPIGILKDWSTPVSSVHIGLVFILSLSENHAVKVKEKGLSGKFVEIEEVNLDELESWSRFVLENKEFLCKIKMSNNPTQQVSTSKKVNSTKRSSKLSSKTKQKTS